MERKHLTQEDIDLVYSCGEMALLLERISDEIGQKGLIQRNYAIRNAASEELRRLSKKDAQKTIRVAEFSRNR